MTFRWRQYLPRMVALVAMLALYGAARLPSPPRSEMASLAARFHFAEFDLPTAGHEPLRSVRTVNPSFAHIAAWISAVGGAVALHDLDGDGLPNDFCAVDVRVDRAMVGGVPTSPRRYDPFPLDPAPLRYDPATMAPMGCLPGDFNEDGRADVLVYYWGRTPVLFLQRPETGGEGFGAGRFVPQELVEGADRWFTNAATAADVDGDGHVDLVIGNYFPDGAHVLDAAAPESEHMQHSMSRAFNGGKNRVLLWVGAEVGDAAVVRFREAPGAFEEAWATGWTLAVGACDLDGDFLPELYFANDFGPDRLLHNLSRPGQVRFALLHGTKTLTTPRSKVVGSDSFKGMGVDFGDVNGDGLFDIYVSNIAAEYALEESHFLWMSEGNPEEMGEGRAPYHDAGEALGLSRSGWGWDTRLADFDNDGILEAVQATGFVRGERNRWPELHELAMGNDDLLSHPASWPRFQPGDDLSGHEHNPFFVRTASGRYADLAPEVGLGLPQVTRGLALADVDGDGDLDLAAGNQWEPSRFYRNDAPQAGASLVLSLLLPAAEVPLRTRPGPPGADTPGSPAVGAVARVDVQGRVLVAQVDGGNGHSGKRSPEIHLGLGTWDRATPVPVALRWRDRQGRVREATLELLPGWHTVVLGVEPGRVG